MILWDNFIVRGSAQGFFTQRDSHKNIGVPKLDSQYNKSNWLTLNNILRNKTDVGIVAIIKITLCTVVIIFVQFNESSKGLCGIRKI